MTHWNYRVIAKRLPEYNDVNFGIYEVYYDENNEPISFTEDPINIESFISYDTDPIESINWQLDAIKLALKKPVMDYDNFPNEYIPYTRKKKLEEIEKYIE